MVAQQPGPQEFHVTVRVHLKIVDSGSGWLRPAQKRYPHDGHGR